MTPQKRAAYFIRKVDLNKYNDELSKLICIEENDKQVSFTSMFKRFNTKGAIIHQTSNPILKVENLEDNPKFFTILRAQMELAKIPTHNSVSELKSRTRTIISEGLRDYNF